MSVGVREFESALSGFVMLRFPEVSFRHCRAKRFFSTAPARLFTPLRPVQSGVLEREIIPDFTDDRLRQPLRVFSGRRSSIELCHSHSYASNHCLQSKFSFRSEVAPYSPQPVQFYFVVKSPERVVVVAAWICALEVEITIG